MLVGLCWGVGDDVMTAMWGEKSAVVGRRDGIVVLTWVGKLGASGSSRRPCGVAEMQRGGAKQVVQGALPPQMSSEA